MSRYVRLNTGLAVALFLAAFCSTPVPVPAFQGTDCPNIVVINQTTSTQIIAGKTGAKTYFCTLRWVSATAQSVGLVEGTGTTCGTGTVAIIGGTTASVGEPYAANGGVMQTSSTITISPPATAATGDNICLLQSGSGQLSGVASFVQY